MVALKDIPKGKTPAEAADIQQIINTLTARSNTPLAVTVNDPLKYAIALKNTDAGARGIIIYAADGTTVLLQVDSAGVKVSPDGTSAAAAPLTHLGPATSDAAAGDHIHGAGGYSATGTTSLEALYTGSWVVTGTNYPGVGGFGANIMYIFAGGGITVTLPDAATTNRPITVYTLSGTTTVHATGGRVIGGSVNTSTGAVMDGVVNTGDSITYKSDATDWIAV